VGVTDLDHGVGLEGAQLTDAHAGAGQDLHGEAFEGVGFVGQGAHELRCRGVVEEAGQGLVAAWDVAVEQRIAGRRILIAPLDDPFEEHPEGSQPLASGQLGHDRAVTGGSLSEVTLVGLEVVAVDVGDVLQGGVEVEEEGGELAQGGGVVADALLGQ
jgi:hypothetical protein